MKQSRISARTTAPADLEGEQEADGSYAVRVPKSVQEPVDWIAVAFMVAVGAGLVWTFARAARWLLSW
ncbi:hypothetical protein [Aureimonas jatrophae]|uniref:hypothetical protein n=1 Tax=Aureimonas jatrophae TaxID=1166073 RepID=UPI000B81C085|nr:hypothetical protein [Aureimonas jatrophae]MBB3952607.1 hypothetical protein [Aureimonas jatrophae]